MATAHRPSTRVCSFVEEEFAIAGLAEQEGDNPSLLQPGEEILIRVLRQADVPRLSVSGRVPDG